MKKILTIILFSFIIFSVVDSNLDRGQIRKNNEVVVVNSEENVVKEVETNNNSNETSTSTSKKTSISSNSTLNKTDSKNYTNKTNYEKNIITNSQNETNDYNSVVVYWLSTGEVYHYNKNCRTLSRSVKTLYSGSPSQSGKIRACKVCG